MPPNRDDDIDYVIRNAQQNANINFVNVVVMLSLIAKDLRNLADKLEKK